MPKPKEEEAKAEPEPVPHVQCRRCDWYADQKPGHIVENGVVVKCPFIDMEIAHVPGF